VTAWQVCEDCGDDWCNLHGMHTKDCPCPMHCEWESDPLATDAAKMSTPTTL
jgi:hypothetical protein